MDKDTIKAKIAKLLNMADPERGGSAQECEIALRQAESMMQKYGISQAEIGIEAGSRYHWESGFYAFGRDGKPTKKNPDWFNWTAVGVANFTDTIVVQSYDTELGLGVTYKGHDDDVVFALWLIAYLKNSIRLATRDAKLGNTQNRQTFRKTMALALTARMKQMRQQRDQVFKEAGTALVVVETKKQERDEFFGAPQYKSATRSIKLHGEDAIRKAYQAAEKVQFNKPIDNSVNSRQLA